jgi:CubicO group peptidase (beta-lactamase class C family)
MDLSKTIMMYLRKGQGILSEALLAEMWQPQVPLPSQPNTSLFAEGEVMASQAHYAFGLRTEDFFGEPLLSHGGSVGVATAHMAFLPQSKLGVALLTNGSGYPTGQFAKVALATLLDKDWLDLPFMRMDTQLTSLTGHYETYKSTMTAHVQTQADFLKLIFLGGSQPEEVILVPERLGEEVSHFFTLTGGQRLPVSFHKRHDIVELVFERYKFKRVSA